MAWLSANGRGDVGSALICTHMKCGEYTLPGRVRSDTADLGRQFDGPFNRGTTDATNRADRCGVKKW